jgi:hypothetical protein
MPGKRPPKPIDHDESEVRTQLDLARQDFEAHGDPFAPWEAFLLWRVWRATVPLPDWILEHFQRIAVTLASSRNPEKAYAREISNVDLARAMGFGRPGRGGTAGRELERRKDDRLAGQVLAAVRAGAKVKTAITEVATANRTGRTRVETAWLNLPAQLRRERAGPGNPPGVSRAREIPPGNSRA